MKTTVRRRLTAIALTTLGCWGLMIGCTYESPITEKPTAKLNPKLLDYWTGADEEKSHMNVRQWDESTYVVSYDGTLYRGHHSDVAGLPLVSLQSLQEPVGKWAYLTWKLSADGNTLELRLVNEKVIPAELKTAADVSKALKEQAKNPDLFDKPARFTRGQGK